MFCVFSSLNWHFKIPFKPLIKEVRNKEETEVFTEILTRRASSLNYSGIRLEDVKPFFKFVLHIKSYDVHMM